MQALKAKTTHIRDQLDSEALTFERFSEIVKGVLTPDHVDALKVKYLAQVNKVGIKIVPCISSKRLLDDLNSFKTIEVSPI